jgi:hypothetical protein
MRLKLSTAIAFASLAAANPVQSQNVAPAPAAPQLSYADLADLALPAPVVAHLRIRGADALHADEAPGLAPGFRRFLVQAEIVALIRGDGGLPPQVSYLVDLPNDSRGHAARLRRRDEVLLLARRVPNRPAELRLVAPDAQLPYTPAAAERLRTILGDATAAGAPPRITGIGRAFHVPGSLPGESETQIFLQTEDGRPISLSILRRPGERPRWSVALSEIVDEAAAPPAPDTLLWYRLACTLPRLLPPPSLSEASPDEAQAIAADYRLVIEGLGRCVRTRVRR